jgi:peptidoglycan biosynthesis protein MviN/MurJ (putative lipid II flippase)
MGMTAEMLRITFPYLGFISLTAFAGALLNSFHRYAIPAFTPVWLNVTMIVAAVFVAPTFETPVMALAWGVFAAGLIQLLFQLPALRRINMLIRPRVELSHPGVRRVGRLMVPAIFAGSVSQINALVDSMICSLLASGSISWLYYSDRLLELPVGIVAVTIATVLLPNLSRLSSRGDMAAFSRTIDWGVRHVSVVRRAAAAALYVGVAADGDRVLPRCHDGFDVTMASLSLQAFAVGLLRVLSGESGGTGILCARGLPRRFTHRRGDGRVEHRSQPRSVSRDGTCRRGVCDDDRGHRASYLLLARRFAAVCIVRASVCGVRRESGGRYGHDGRGTRSGLAVIRQWMHLHLRSRLWMAGLCTLGGAVYFVVLLLAGFRLRDLRYHV